MPVVTIDMWEGRTKEQKKELASVITNAMVEIAKTTPEHVNIIFRDVKKEDWAIGGQLSSES
jgi:4-oxalocrotonate tautomerase